MRQTLFLHKQTGKRKCQQLTAAQLRGAHRASRRVSVTDKSTGADVRAFPVSARDFFFLFSALYKLPIKPRL